MQFLEFWREKDRMCEYNKGLCKENKCPLFDIKSRQYHYNCQLNCGDYPKESEQKVEQWSKKHPIVRNCDKLHEVFGNGFKMMMHDTLDVFISCNGEEIPMSEWMYQEYKEPEGENEKS